MKKILNYYFYLFISHNFYKTGLGKWSKKKWITMFMIWQKFLVKEPSELFIKDLFIKVTKKWQSKCLIKNLVRFYFISVDKDKYQKESMQL